MHIIELLRNELQKPLPGEEAQYRMAPAYRPRLTREQIVGFQPRESGVMLLLYHRQGTLYLVFTQRSHYAGVHSGQMSFPGGKKEEGDRDLLDTAMRETAEEIGVAPTQIEVVGQLSELYVPPSNFLVYPVVGYGGELHTFYPQQKEVEKIVEIPVSFFLDANNIHPHTDITLSNGLSVKVPAYIYAGHIIWGATAIMMSEFTVVLERALGR